MPLARGRTPDRKRQCPAGDEFVFYFVNDGTAWSVRSGSEPGSLIGSNVQGTVGSEGWLDRSEPAVRDSLSRMPTAFIGMGANLASWAGPPEATLVAARNGLARWGG